MSLFTPWSGLLGGTILGTSASLLLLSNGDILGCSGIMRAWIPFPLPASSTGPTTADDRYWKLVFIAAFVLTTRLTLLTLGVDAALTASTGEALEQSTDIIGANIPSTSSLLYAVSGLLVGVGTTLGKGCTSGHGICGLARYSPRSLVAVLAFLTTGIATATLYASSSYYDRTSLPPVQASLGWIVTMGGLAAATAFGMRRNAAKSPVTPTNESSSSLLPSKEIGAALSGALFAVGLAVSGMTQSAKVLGFLNVSPLLTSSMSLYDPTLLTVLGSAVVTSWLSYQYIATSPSVKPLCSGVTTFSIPTSVAIDGTLLVGSVCFGLGWGLTGLCPGPALFAAAAGVGPVAVAWLPCFFVGSYSALQIQQWFQHNRVKAE